MPCPEDRITCPDGKTAIGRTGKTCEFDLSTCLNATTTTQPTDKTADSSTTLTTSWKTYRNEEFGFEVKYPLEWKIGNSGTFRTIAEVVIYPPIFSLNTCLELDDDQKSKECAYALAFQRIKKSESYKDIEDYANKFIKIWQPILEAQGLTFNSKEKLQNIDGIKIVFIDKDGDKMFNTLIEANNAIIEIKSSQLFGDKNYEKIHDQILSTFKFIK